MGFFHCGMGRTFEFDDRTLTHLRTVILSKFARAESFAFTWVEGGKQHSLWMHPTMPLMFEFEGPTTEQLNSRWVDELVLLASSPGGLQIAPEPATDS